MPNTDGTGAPPRSGIRPVPGRCPRCDVQMDTGSIVQHFEASWQNIAWRSDDATIVQRLLGRGRLSLAALRCPECYLVELYAPPA